MKMYLVQRKLAIMVMISMLVSLVILPIAGLAADVEVVVKALPPTADAVIQSDTANPTVANTVYDKKNGSTDGLFNLSTSNASKKEMYLKFDVSTASDSAYTYILQVSAKRGSSEINTPIQVYGLESTTWKENELTWNNAPETDLTQLTKIVDEFIITQPNKIGSATQSPVLYDVDVTDYVRQHLANGAVSFVLNNSTVNSVNIYSKDGTGSNLKTQLLVKRSVQSDTTPPQWPANSALKSLNLGTDFVQLAWPAATDENTVSNYKIYQNDSLLTTVVGSTYYTVQGLTPNTSVTYSVYAGDPVGNYSLTPLTYTVTTLSAPVTPLPIIEVNASSSDGNVESNTLDNNLYSRWSASGDGQYIMFDLGQTEHVGYIGIAFYKGDQRSTSIDIETSNDAVAWTNVFHGSSRPVTANMQAFDIPDTDARFVRIIGHGNSDGNTFTSLTDVMIYPPFPSGDTPVAVVPNIIPTTPPGAVPFTKAGLTNPDGTVHAMHTPNPVTGSTLNVVDFGADPADNANDDRIAIQNAINAASAGDEVFLPNGVYNLITSPDGFINIKLKSGVNLRGESEAGAILKSSIDDIKNSSVVKSSSQHDILVSNLTVTSTWDRTFSTEHTTNNPEAGGPDSSIAVTNYGEVPSYNVTIDHVTVDRFRRMAIRIESSHDVVVRHSTFHNATDLGGGGAGYGTSIQGIPKVDRLGFDNDTYWNVVEDSTFQGPYLRHGSLIQNVAHNNVLRNNHYLNTKLDSVDLHGELEYLNEVYGNTMENILTGGGVGLGNTGGTAPTNHSKSGPKNYIHDNVISNSREGIVVTMGTPDTVIEHNIIENTTSVANAVGINVLNGPGTHIMNNTIRNNTATNYWGILLEHDNGDQNANFIGEGDPQDVQIVGNIITGNTNGIQLQTGSNINVSKNILDNSGTNYDKAAGVTATEEWPSTNSSSGSASSSAFSVGTPLSDAGSLTSKVTVVDGQSVAAAAVDAKVLDSILKAQGNGALHVVVDSPSDVAQVQITLDQQVIQKLNESPAVTIETVAGSFQLPVKQLNMSELAIQLGEKPENVKIEVTIGKNDKASQQAKESGLNVVASLDSTMKAIAANGKSAEIASFPTYVPYTIQLDNAVNERNLAAVRVTQDAQGNTSYEPVPFVFKSGVATLYSHSNSAFLLVANNITFTDTAHHWAKDGIERMANRWLVQGVSKDEFRPDQAITRAELAAILTRTLGIQSSTSSAAFTDVNKQEWYNNAINAAVEGGIITGYDDGTFRPDQTITREEMAVMIDRALQIAGYDKSQATQGAPAFTDQNQMKPWSKAAITRLVQLHAMDGMSATSFEPNQEATRAQSAVLLQRLLQIVTFTQS